LKDKRSIKEFFLKLSHSKAAVFIKNFIIKLFFLIFNPRFLLCFGIGWLITNGWAYVFMAFGVYFGIEWMVAVSGAYLTILWFPFSPEKIVTVAIALGLLKFLFPNDEKTLGILRDLYQKAKSDIKIIKAKRKDKKENKNNK